MDFAHSDKVVQRFHCLFYGCLGVEAVDLEQVEIVCAEAGEGGVDGFEDGGAGETAPVDVVFVVGRDLAVFLSTEVGAEEVVMTCQHISYRVS